MSVQASSEVTGHIQGIYRACTGHVQGLAQQGWRETAGIKKVDAGRRYCTYVHYVAFALSISKVVTLQPSNLVAAQLHTTLSVYLE